MILLKPRGRLRRLTLGSQQVINVLAESRIGQHALELVPRDRLQDNPGILREFPQRGIKLPPHFVGGMIPRPAHIQGKLRQGIEPLDVRGQKAVNRMADACLFAHRFCSNLFWTEFRMHQFDSSSPFTLNTASTLICSGTAAKASLTIVWASSRMRRR